MCENGNVTLRWVKKSKRYFKEMPKQEMLVVFEGLAKGFSDDNEMSIKLIDIIQKAELMSLNKDIMQYQDTPFITYNIGGASDILRIRRRHKIVWSILERFFTE